MPIKVTVIVSGGNVQDCYADDPQVEIEMLDFDNFEGEGKDAVEKAEARVTEVTAKMHHVY